MDRKHHQPELPGFESAAELTLADHIPVPGNVFEALWDAIPRLPTAPFEMVGALSELLPEFELEAGG
jgi:hypothetical protein